MPQVASHVEQSGGGLLHARVLGGLSIAALLAYFAWRVSSTMVPNVLAFALLAVELWFALGHVLALVPAMFLSPKGDVDPPSTVPRVDVVVVVRNETLATLRVTFRSALEVRGSERVGVVSVDGRRDVHALCRKMDVDVLSASELATLGFDEDGQLDRLLLIPGDYWVSADIAVDAEPAFQNFAVGAVGLATRLHSNLSVPGASGYEASVFGDDGLSRRFDSTGVPTAVPGPMVCSVAALCSVDGVSWSASDPILATRSRLSRVGWRVRSLAVEGSFRMAPASEEEALERRARGIRGWYDAERSSERDLLVSASEPAERRWRRVVAATGSVETWSGFARFVALLVPMVALATGHMPVAVDPLSAITFGGAWLGFGWLARYAAGGRARWPGRSLRAGFRTVGADMGAVIRRAGEPPSGRDLTRYQLLAVVFLAVGWAVSVGVLFLRGGAIDGQGFELGLMLVPILVLPLLVRDAIAAFGQSRVVPRAKFSSQVEGEVAAISPKGIDVVGELPLGSKHRVELELPLGRHGVVRADVRGKVMAHRVKDGHTRSFIKIETDPDLATELIYFCAVTAPTMTDRARARLTGRPLATLT